LRLGRALSRLTGKIVLLTGASAGIGRASARALSREGCTVLAVARDQVRLRELASESNLPGAIIPLTADVSSTESMDALAREVRDAHGIPDILVANAGIQLDARFVDTTDEAMRRVYEVNVFGVLRTVRPFLTGMVTRRSGRILIVSSVVGKRGIPNYAAYASSKFALHGLADSLRPEILGTGVTVGLICPSSTESELADRALTAGPRQNRVRLQRHSAESVARAMVRMARSRRREVVLSPEGKLMVALDRIAPGLVDRVLARFLVKNKN
jgi:short-subunit dehydrogenase